MFKVNHKPEFSHDVIIMVPTDDGHEEQKLRTRFRAITLSEAAEYDMTTWEGQQAYLERVVLSFENLVDEDGKAVECTAEQRAATLDLSYVRQALITHLNVAMFKVKVGN